LGIELDNISFIPLGVDTNLFIKNEADRTEIRTKLGIPNTDILIIYAGKITPDKDLEVLLQASAPSLVDNDLKLLLVGSGPSYYRSSLLKIVDKLRLNDKVIMHEFVKKEELPKFYSAADLGIWSGGISSTTQEAMSTSLPIIVVRSDSANHLIEYDNGLSFPRGDIEALRECITLLIENEGLRLEMGKRSRKLAEDKLSWTNIAKQTMDLYNSI
jgi:glycosyltransferase involved in cell wall biosynthesis